MSHASEFFLMFSSFFLCQRQLVQKMSWPLTTLMGFAATLIAVVRHNDFTVTGFICLWFVYFTFVRDRSRFLKQMLVFGCGAAAPLVYFFLLYYLETGSLFYKVSNYDKSFGLWMIYQISWLDLKRIFDFFAGPYWGLLLLMPGMIFEGAVICLRFSKLKALARTHWPLFLGAAIFGFIHLLVIANYSNNGMSYGYRYTLPVVFGFHVLFIISIGHESSKIFRKKTVLAGLFFLAVIASFNVINFESNSTTLTLTPGRLEDDGILDPSRKDVIELRGSHYVFHSLAYTLTGRAFQNLVASPAGAYVLFSLKPFLKSPPSVLQRAFSYYDSPKRGIGSFADLRVLISYQIIILLFLFLFILVF